jgi:hypothetical protein
VIFDNLLIRGVLGSELDYMLTSSAAVLASKAIFYEILCGLVLVCYNNFGVYGLNSFESLGRTAAESIELLRALNSCTTFGQSKDSLENT